MGSNLRPEGSLGFWLLSRCFEIGVRRVEEEREEEGGGGELVSGMTRLACWVGIGLFWLWLGSRSPARAASVLSGYAACCGGSRN